jgi:hypothetical protein
MGGLSKSLRLRFGERPEVWWNRSGQSLLKTHPAAETSFPAQKE